MVKKTKGNGYRKTERPSRRRNGRPGPTHKDFLKEILKVCSGPPHTRRRGNGKGTGGHGYKKLSRRDFQDFLGNGYDKLRRRIWAGTQFFRISY